MNNVICKLGAIAALALIPLCAAQAKATSGQADEAAIRKLLDDGCEGFVKKDIKAAMAPYGRDLYTFDIAPPQHKDYAQLYKENKELMDAVASTPTCTYREMTIKSYGNVAYAHYILPYSVTLKSGASIDLEGRGTDVFEKSRNKWRIVHEHFSVPVNPMTGQGMMKATPAAQ